MAFFLNPPKTLGTGWKAFSPLKFQAFELIYWGPNTRFPNEVCHCISLMPEYQEKSFEELRLEDYTLAQSGSFSETFNRNTSRTSPTTSTSPSVLSRNDDDDASKKVMAFVGIAPQNGEGDVERETLLSLLECPVCYETCCPPIYTCIIGHHICKKCKTQVKNMCPMCRKRFVGTRNLLAEELYRKLELVEVRPEKLIFVREDEVSSVDNSESMDWVQSA